MSAYIVKRLGLMVVAVIGATAIAFGVLELAPGDAARMIAYDRYGEDLTAQQIEEVRQSEYLDAPLVMRYCRWLGQVTRGDLGRSVATGNSVFTEIRQRLPATLQLAVASVAIAVLVGLPLGIVAAVHRGSWPDALGRLVALIGVSIPNFWLALLLILLFALFLKWLPSFGYGTFAHLLLPALTLGTALAALTARITRSSMLDVMDAEYIRTARAKGLDEGTVIFKHALRNALIPVVTVSGLQFGRLLEGAIVVESVFGWPGLGRLLVDSIFARDYMVLQGCILVVALLIVAVNFIVDLSYAWLDPRIRYGEKT
ncbi:MAG: nickel ABC transporter permease [Armatimonadota bacterium]